VTLHTGLIVSTVQNQRFHIRQPADDGISVFLFCLIFAAYAAPGALFKQVGRSRINFTVGVSLQTNTNHNYNYRLRPAINLKRYWSKDQQIQPGTNKVFS